MSLHLGAIGIVWLILIGLVNPIGDFPLNDDWVYALGVKSLVEHGYFQVPAYSSANVGPHLVWGALFALPFGLSFTALRISTLVLGLAGAFALYGLFDRVWRDRRLALIAALTLVTNPLYVALAHTFMTDVPFAALMTWTMYCMIHGIQTRNVAYIVSGLLLGLVVTTMRQFGLIVFVGFALGWLARGGLGWRNLLIAISPLAVALAVHFAFTHWLLVTGRKPVQDVFGPHSFLSPGPAVRVAAREAWSALHYVGLFLLPLGIACLLRGLTKTNFKKVISVVGVLAIGLGALLLLRSKGMPLSINVLNYYGIGPLTLRDSLVLGANLPPETERSAAWWAVITVLTQIGLAILLVASVSRVIPIVNARRVQNTQLWVVAFFVGIAGSYLVLLLFITVYQYTLFDRYLLPLVIIAALGMPVLSMDASGKTAFRRSAFWIPLCLVACFGCFSAMTTHEYLESNRIRWRALADLTKNQGVGPDRIDGGYEFNGFLFYSPTQISPPEKSFYWVVDDEFVVTTGPLRGYHEVARYPFRYWLTGRASDILILQRSDALR